MKRALRVVVFLVSLCGAVHAEASIFNLEVPLVTIRNDPELGIHGGTFCGDYFYVDSDGQFITLKGMYGAVSIMSIWHVKNFITVIDPSKISPTMTYITDERGASIRPKILVRMPPGDVLMMEPCLPGPTTDPRNI